jgi:superfamily II DNA or RNA helicase
VKSLRPYQQQAIAAIDAEFRGGIRRTLAVMATGCGKTYTASEYVAAHTTGKVLWLAHRTELIDQAAASLVDSTGLEVEVERAGSWAREAIGGGSRIVVGSVQTQMAKWTDRKRMHRFDPNDFDLLVIDEAHHALSSTYRQIIDHYRRNAALKVLGLTATPKRADGKALGAVFESVAFEFHIRQAVDEGWLVRPKVRAVRVGALDLSTVRTTAGDLNGADLAAALTLEKPLLQMASALLDLVGKRSTLVFCASVDHATRMAEILRRGGVTAEVVTGKTKDDDRREMFRAFNAGELQYLCNVGVATEGTDLPRCEVIGSCRPTKSISLATQMYGRALRPFSVNLMDGPVQGRLDAIANSPKPYAEVIDFVGNSGRHKLVSPVDLLGGSDLDDEVRERVLKKVEDGEAADIDEAIEQSLAEAEAEAEAAAARAKAERERIEELRKNLFAKAEHTSRFVCPFDVLDLPPPSSIDVSKPVEMATDKQQAFLARQGIANVELLTKREAHSIQQRLFSSFKGNAATFKQLCVLRDNGYPTKNVTKAAASEMIDRIFNGRNK